MFLLTVGNKYKAVFSLIIMALPRRAFVITGTFLLVAGIAFLINSFSNFTGFVVFEGSDVTAGVFVAIWFLCGKGVHT